jgi:hypothetical protein
MGERPLGGPSMRAVLTLPFMAHLLQRTQAKLHKGLNVLAHGGWPTMEGHVCQLAYFFRGHSFSAEA